MISGYEGSISLFLPSILPSIHIHTVPQFPSASSKDQVGPLLPDFFPVSTWGFHIPGLVFLVEWPKIWRNYNKPPLFQ